jgi:Tol biopolymer transport system component
MSLRLSASRVSAGLVNGSLTYLPGPASLGVQDLFLFDRKGDWQPLKLPQGSYRYLRVSPDGTRVVFESNDDKETFVSIYDLSGSSSARRLTFGSNNRYPIWSADGKHVVFQSDRNGAPSLFWHPSDGGSAEALTKAEAGEAHVPESCSPAGDVVLFSVVKEGVYSLSTLSIADRKTAPWGDVRSESLPTDAVFSPDGRWVAYQTGRSDAGEATTFVQPYPATGAKHQIARGGRPAWSRDGKELFLVPAPGQFMVVNVSTRPSFAFTNPAPVPRGFGIADPGSPRPYDVTPDGRILGVATHGQVQTGSSAATQIRVVLNWFEELKARAPGK